MMNKLPVNPLNDGMMTPYVNPEVAEYKTNPLIFTVIWSCISPLTYLFLESLQESHSFNDDIKLMGDQFT